MSKQDQIQDSTATASLADLPLTAEQTEQTKGGTGKTMAAEVIARDLRLEQ